jgi:O-methyltransferase
MRYIFIRSSIYFKNFILITRIGKLLGFMSTPLIFLGNALRMGKEVNRLNQQKVGMNDFFTWKRDHSKREALHQFIIEKEALKSEAIIYIEFGVFNGKSFKYWVESNTNASSKFYGFDTFEGLPENWGGFKAGDMLSGIPQIDSGNRHVFFKGLFQDTLYPFLNQYNLHENKRLVIHLDADLFSSTLYALCNLDRYLKTGDIIIFDEYNVPNHEFLAFETYKQAYYRKFELLGAVNNFYQTAFKMI